MKRRSFLGSLFGAVAGMCGVATAKASAGDKTPVPRGVTFPPVGKPNSAARTPTFTGTTTMNNNASVTWYSSATCEPVSFPSVRP